jgi:transcriptional regulator with XRE-family HTH domain
MPIEHTEPGVIFGRRVAQVRRHHGWTQAELAKRMSDLGWNVDQAAIARIESKKPSTRAQNVRLAEVLALAAALGVSPLFLFLPIEDNEEVKIAGLRLRAWEVREWVRGLRPLRPEDDHHIFQVERDPESFDALVEHGVVATTDPNELLRVSEELRQRQEDLETQISSALRLHDADLREQARDLEAAWKEGEEIKAEEEQRGKRSRKAD